VKKFHVKGEHPNDEHLDDIRRIRDIVRANGYDCSDDQAKALWDKYSDSMSASWMGLDKDDVSIWWHISHYVVEEEGEKTEETW
jgi:hypothetical protein